MRKKVALIFGGRSMEHDVSIITAQQILSNIDRSKYIVKQVYMRDGDYFDAGDDKIDSFVDFDVTKHKKLIFLD